VSSVVLGELEAGVIKASGQRGIAVSSSPGGHLDLVTDNPWEFRHVEDLQRINWLR
jgi:hypothetical protein